MPLARARVDPLPADAHVPSRECAWHGGPRCRPDPRNPMIPAFDRIDHIHLYATDRNNAEQWYADVMGFKRVPELESWADGGPLTLSNSSGTVHIALFEAPAQPCRSVIALSVGAEEFVAWRRHLVDMLKQPGEPESPQLAWSLYFADPDGTPWEITTYQHAIVATLLEPIGT